MITKTGNAVLQAAKPRFGKKWMLLPAAAVAAHHFTNNLDASLHYADPKDNTYYREPGIIYDTLKRNPYAHT